MRFVETPIFTKEVLDLLDDDEYRALQLALIFRPEQGAIIPGSGGLRVGAGREEANGEGCESSIIRRKKRTLFTCCSFIQRMNRRT
jgi:hypothetical protein